MKKIFILSSLLLLCLASCQDVNDKFDWLDDATKPTDLLNKTITIGNTDIATIVSATKKTENEAYGVVLNKDTMFSDLAPAEILIPYLLPTMFLSPDQGSSVTATYQFKKNRDALLSDLSTSTDNPAFVLSDADYKAVWGNMYVSALTPQKSPNVELPKLLASKYPNAESGSYKIIEYAYSKEEPVLGEEVKNKETVYTAYQKVNGVWKSAETSDIIVLQPKDYTIDDNKLPYFSATDAERYISGVLMDTQVLIIGSEKVVVYKTSNTTFYAERLTYSAETNWTFNSVVEARSSQFILSSKGWIFDPTFVINMTAEDYQLVVDYVITHQAVETPTLVNSYKNTEYYYGFNSRNKNITYREKDRTLDPTYPISGTEAEKLAFCEKRTIEGLNIFLGSKYPDAQPQLNGIDQKAKITFVIYYGPAGTNVATFTYEFQCIGNKEWKFLKM